jgi:hypothetical protein
VYRDVSSHLEGGDELTREFGDCLTRGGHTTVRKRKPLEVDAIRKAEAG